MNASIFRFMLDQCRGVLSLVGVYATLLGVGSLPVSADPQQTTQPTSARTPQTVTGRLDQNSAVFESDGSYYEIHTFEGTAGEALTIELNSDSFDAYLMLNDVTGQRLEEDDDGGEGSNARLVLELPQSGTYQILVNTYDAGATGDYQLTLESATTLDLQLLEADRLTESLMQLYEEGHYQEAIEQGERALNIRISVLGELHLDIATSLDELALPYSAMNRYAEVVPIYQRALSIREEILGDEHSDTSESLYNLGWMYLALNRYDEAERLYQRAFAANQNIYGTDRPAIAFDFNRMAILYESIGRYDKAETFYQQALNIRDEHFGANHSATAFSLNNLALFYRQRGRYSEAEPLYKRALLITEEQSGPEHSNTATILQHLAELYRLMVRYDEAEPLYKRSLAINENHLGADHPRTEQSIYNLAAFYETLGRYADAEPLYKRAIAISQERLAPDHPSTAQAFSYLGNLYTVMGRYSDAEVLHQKAVAIMETQMGPEHPYTAVSLNHLALLYDSLNRYSEAEALYQRALAINEMQFGSDHPEMAPTLHNLAALYASLSRYSEAEPLYQRALAINEMQLGPDHPNTATTLNNLASLYTSVGRYNEAEPLHQRALAINEMQLGPDHPDTAISLDSLALLHWVQGQPKLAFGYLQQSLSVQETIFSRNLVIGSDADKRDYLATASNTFNQAISLSLNERSVNNEAAHLALTILLQRKGRILDLLTNLRAKLTGDPAATMLLDELTKVNNQVSSLTFNPPSEIAPETLKSQLKILIEQSTTLERELSQRSSEFANLTASPSLESIQSALNPETALVEFVRYQSFDPTREPSERFGTDHYAAYILNYEGTIKGIDLGPAEPIDAAISTLTRSLASPGTPMFQVKEEAQVLDSLVMALVRQALGNMTTVFISPDSALNLIPFEALVDENNNYLVERYQFRYLTSGRDLMRVANTPASRNPAVLMGGPTFSRAGETIRESVEVAQRAIDLENNIFPSLEGTETEIQEIAKRLNVDPYLRTTATEAQLKAIDSPSILHVATHGFFKPIEDNTSNPLLQSGLVLAGVKERQSGPEEDGILTALELTGMKLQGTQLAILSACETGLGELAVGEGVYGLRRALVLAGTQSQVISLWKVDDNATQELMVDYYDRLLSGIPRDAALRETQLALLEHEEYSHPYYWSAFIGSGDWRPLN